jgi:hypothetical protein
MLLDYRKEKGDRTKRCTPTPDSAPQSEAITQIAAIIPKRRDSQEKGINQRTRTFQRQTQQFKEERQRS